MKHTCSLQFIACILIVGLFLQSCSGFANTPLSDIEGHNKQLDIQLILDKEFIAEGRHLVSFYQEQEKLKATVHLNYLDEKDKIYDEVNVVVEKGVELSSLAKLDTKMQQKRIQIRFAEEQKGKPKSVVVHKPWLMGGEREVIMFCGNPGVGKSTLCNSIFGRRIFESGVSIRTGMTTKKQEYLYEGKLYIDTPGLADSNTRTEAGKEIEEALKQNGNYKVVFVITLKAGRLKPEDIDTINTVGETIKVPFEYGLVINKISEGVRNQISQKGLSSYLESFKKRPYATVILSMDEEIEDEDNKYFEMNSQNRQSLINFLDQLRSNQIRSSDIESLDTADYKIKAFQMEQERRRIREETQRIEEEHRRRVAELNARVSRLRAEQDDGGCTLF
ncbi:MAG: GTPase domain-containing protein [Candidatus Amoebophilus sp.]